MPVGVPVGVELPLCVGVASTTPSRGRPDGFVGNIHPHMPSAIKTTDCVAGE